MAVNLLQVDAINLARLTRAWQPVDFAFWPVSAHSSFSIVTRHIIPNASEQRPEHKRRKIDLVEVHVR